MPSMQQSTTFLQQGRVTFFIAIAVLVAAFMPTGFVSAVWSNSTDCSAAIVTSCRSDSSIKGENAGVTICDSVGLDYFPACNESKCKNPDTGKYGYACGKVPSVDTTSATCDNFNCYAPGQCPSGKVASTTCGGTCPPPGGLNALTSYCVVAPTDTGITGAGSGACGAGFAPQAGVCFPTETGLPDPQGGMFQILGNFFSWLFAIFAFLAVGAFVISGIQYLIASGSDDMIKTAKNNMKWSLVGVIVGLSGWVILQAVFNALSANPFF